MANELGLADQIQTLRIRYSSKKVGRSRSSRALCLLSVLLGIISVVLLVLSMLIYLGNKKRNKDCVKSEIYPDSGCKFYNCKMLDVELWMERGAALALGLSVLLAIDWNCRAWCVGRGYRLLAVFFFFLIVVAVGGAGYFFWKLFHADGINTPKELSPGKCCCNDAFEDFQDGKNHIFAIILASLTTLFATCYVESAQMARKKESRQPGSPIISRGVALPVSHTTTAIDSTTRSEGTRISPRVGTRADTPSYVDANSDSRVNLDDSDLHDHPVLSIQR